MSQKNPLIALALGTIMALAGCATPPPPEAPEGDVETLPDAGDPVTAGTCGSSGGTYIVLDMGHQLVFTDDDGENVETITVLAETKTIDGVETRVVEEKDMEEGELVESSRKYYAVCDGDVYLYGEDEVEYDDGVAEAASWEAGKAGAERRLAMPGQPAVGQVFVTADGANGTERVEIVALGETVTVPAGTFSGAVKVKETSSEIDDEEEDEDADDADEAADEDEGEEENETDDAGDFAWYAAGVGLLREEDLTLLAYGQVGEIEVPASLPDADDDAPPVASFTESRENCTFAPTGDNPFFPLQVGYRQVLAGEDEDGEPEEVVITVTNETRVVDGVTTRVVTEEESVDGELEENSWNFFATCVETGAVYYFGEEVDIYDDGELESHEGAWLAGADGAVAGVVMPGNVSVGWKAYQEYHVGVAEDFAEIVALDETVVTPAGTFTGAIKVKETTRLEPGNVEYKWYAPGVGIVVDGPLKLRSYGPST